MGVGQNGGSFCHPCPPWSFLQLFFRSVIPYWAGNVSEKLRHSEFIVYAVVYTCTDPGNFTFQNFLKLFLQIFWWVLFVIRFRLQFYLKKKFLSLYSNMAAPNVNGCLHLTGVHQKSPASLSKWHLKIDKYQRRFKEKKIISYKILISTCLVELHLDNVL